MPALAKPPAVLPRFVPHTNNGALAGAGSLSTPDSVSLAKTHPSSLQPESLAGREEIDRLAHDARNILSGLMLYCELLGGPGVLTAQNGHYAGELAAIVQSTAQIVERMAAAQSAPAAMLKQTRSLLPGKNQHAVPVTDAARNLRDLQPLLGAIAGPAIPVSVAIMPCAGRIALASEDLTRILVNLVRNAADAMPSGGHIRITAQYAEGFSFLAAISDLPAPASSQPYSILLTVTDDGPGIPESLRAQVFEPGFTTRTGHEHTHSKAAHWPVPSRRGLGLSIVRNLVETAGGAVRATSAPGRGARFEITLPLIESITSDTCAAPPNSAFLLTTR
ncbi:MAG TPA: ATP-binding protein [Silvibacterium sp.]|nr:ATP-binding protein [Silvibacterium sp.]